MRLKVDKKEIDEKNKLVNNAITQLKKEFVGIDEQIDSIMSNVRVWFLYPQLQSSPCVVNIFGMTGCGKTSLIRRISQLLNVEKNLVYFNFCAINEQSSWEVEQDIEEQLDNECSNRMFVYDEFQYAATIDGQGAEKDNKNGLKPFWELLDTGVLHKRTSFWENRSLYRVLAYMMRINAACPMEIKNGVWENGEECLAKFNKYDHQQFLDVFNVKQWYGEDNDEDNEGSSRTKRLKRSKNDVETEPDFFLQSHILNRFTELYRKVYNVVCEASDVYCKLQGMNAMEICDLFSDVYEKSLIGYDLNFKHSIIFVIANLDEAYDVAFNVNPDMSPDQFYSITKKINIVDIKKALQMRFRNEQIARLGNIHVIYPSFTSKSFKKIIELHLDSYKKVAKELCGLDLEFDKSVHKVIFDEAVFPTQGTRPIFSTIHEFIKTKLPYVITNIYDNKKDEEAVSIKYSYQKNKSIVKVINGNGDVIDTYKFTDKLRLDKLRESTKDEKQANTAVHESGHFVIYSFLNGKVPSKLISRSAEKQIEGFMMHDVEEEEGVVGSKIDYLNEIKVALGGYVAEGLIFGEDKRSAGASSDLVHATAIASKMVRKWGLSELPYVSTYMLSSEYGDALVNEDNQEHINAKIKAIIDECLKDTERIMKLPNVYEMLTKSSKYLAQHSQMSKKLMLELLNEARANGKICGNNDTYYRDIVNNM